MIPSEERAHGTDLGVNGCREAEMKVLGVVVIKKVRS